MYVAKPYLNVTKATKTFATKLEAVKHLEAETGFEMDYEVNKKMKKQLIAQGMTSVAANELAKTYDWELIGKLYKEG